MNETQRNIKRYRASLPGLRDRIAASAMLLLVSLSMVVSASFAWYTISVSPEVSLISTTVVSNGNLEIALAHGTVQEKAEDREEPDEVALGDSSSTENQTLVGANITWGNLVNLADTSYGLSHMSLRPAKLSENNQSRTPLFGVDYTLDGRIVESSEYYRYASYDAAFGQNGGFVAGEKVQYGVRAISSMTMSNDTEQMEINKLGVALDEQLEATRNAYNAIIKSDPDVSGTYMNALVKMLEKFVNDKAAEVAKGKFPDNVTFAPSDFGSDVAGLQELLKAFRTMLQEESETFRQLVNMHIFDITGEKTGFIPQADANNGEVKGEHIRAIGRTAAERKKLQDMGVPLDLLNLLKEHVTDYDKIQNAIDGIEANLKPMVSAGEKVYWDLSYLQYEKGKEATAEKEKFLDYYITDLVNISKTYVGPVEDSYDIVSKATGTKMKGIYRLADMSDALAVMNADPIEVEIGGGVLLTTEERIGALLLKNNQPYGTQITININVKMTGMAALAAGAINGDHPAAVRTSAGNVAKLDGQINTAKQLVPEPKNMISKDIYGFAVDLWIRTNAQDTILTLEGMTEYQEERGTCTNIYGNTSNLWVVSGAFPGENEGETVEQEIDVYIIYEEVPAEDENGNQTTVWVNNVYEALGHGIIGVREDMEKNGFEFKEKMVKVVYGYNGENRVWQEMIDGGVIPEDSTTQGAGSCYIFYASPSEQPRILEMLGSFTIAFLDGSDNLVATAKLNTEEAFEINGKVTVPLEVVEGVPYVDQIEEGGSTIEVNKRGIMALPRNQAAWMTAIIYLDGELLGNDNVLAAGSIEGRLNLQFGSSVDINSIKNEPLLKKYRTITAVVEGNGSVDDGTIDENGDYPLVQFDYDNTVKTVTARLTIDGDQPTNVTAFFTRMVGQNQGTRMETRTFRNTGGKEWVADFDLIKPGEYRLNSVIVDGSEYVLGKKPGVKIKGQNVGLITCTPNGGSVLTSETFFDVEISVPIQAEESLQPEQVRVLFSYGQNKETAAILGNDGNGVWRGTLRITEPGNYTMTYLVMDDNPDLIPEDQRKSFFVRLGVEAEITCAGVWDKDGNPVADNDPAENTYTIMFTPQQEYTAEMHIKLRGGSGDEIARLSGLKMTYPMDGTSQKMDADLIWVDAPGGGYYVAEMPFKSAGTYVFGTLKEEGAEGIVTNAPIAATVVAVPPDPPSIPDDPISAAPYQYAPNGDATMTVRIFDSAAATVQAKIVNKITGEVHWVDVAKDGRKDITDQIPAGMDVKTYEQYTFMVPTNGQNTYGLKNDALNIGYVAECNGKQDGIWVLEAVRMQQVTDEDENYYPGVKGDYLVFDLTADKVETEVMQVVVTDFTRQGTPYAGQNFTDVAVLQEQKVSGVKFRISDWRGSAEHINNVKLAVSYDSASALTYGGYKVTGAPTSWNWLNTTGSVAAEHNLSDLSLKVAGTYKVDLSYDVVVGNTTATSKITDVLKYTVSTPENLRPTVAITGITPAGGSTIDLHDSVASEKDNHKSEQKMPELTSTTYVMVYVSCTETTQNCSSTHTYTRPTVGITLTGIGQAKTAELLFTPDAANTNAQNQSAANIYVGNDSSKPTQSYVWEKDGEVYRTIGTLKSANSKVAAEKMNANTLVLASGDIQCTFNLATPITIDNPY